MLVATPHYAKDVARGLAYAAGETFDMLTGEARDRFWEMAAWVTDDYVTGDDFHEGCAPVAAVHDAQEQGYEDGYEAAWKDARATLAAVGQGERGERRQALRDAYRALRATESGEAMRTQIQAYMREHAVARR